MSVRLMEITGRSKIVSAMPSALSDFYFRPSGQISQADLLGSPDWTLYCLDCDFKQALFVELPADTDLSEAAFVYEHQFTEARRAALMPVEQFIAASHAVSPPSGLTFLFSTGRCGSTLASRILSRLSKVWSLSEPDYLTNLAHSRVKLPQNELSELIRAATLWTCRPPQGRSSDAIVIKPRSEPILIASACQRACPESRSVFMYRDLLGYVNSAFKFGQRVGGPEAFFAEEEAWRPWWDILMIGLPISYLEEWFTPDHGPIGWSEFLTLVWDLRIDGYLRALRQGMSFTTLHYDDLNTNRTEQTRRLIEACGVSTRHLAQAMTGFAEDSHKGSVGSNASPARSMHPEEKTRATALLALMGKRDYVADRLPDSRTGVH